MRKKLFALLSMLMVGLTAVAFAACEENVKLESVSIDNKTELTATWYPRSSRKLGDQNASRTNARLHVAMVGNAVGRRCRRPGSLLRTCVDDLARRGRLAVLQPDRRSVLPRKSVEWFYD